VEGGAFGAIDSGALMGGAINGNNLSPESLPALPKGQTSASVGNVPDLSGSKMMFKDGVYSNMVSTSVVSETEKTKQQRDDSNVERAEVSDNNVGGYSGRSGVSAMNNAERDQDVVRNRPSDSLPLAHPDSHPLVNYSSIA